MVGRWVRYLDGEYIIYIIFGGKMCVDFFFGGRGL